MTREEMGKILIKIKTAYHTFEISREVLELWYENFKDMPFEKVLVKLDAHIQSSVYAPKIAQLVVFDQTKNEFIEKYYKKVANLNGKH